MSSPNVQHPLILKQIDLSASLFQQLHCPNIVPCINVGVIPVPGDGSATHEFMNANDNTLTRCYTLDTCF